MKSNFSRVISMLLAVIMIFTVIPVMSAAAAAFSLTYDFIGDEADLAGFAQGLITVTPDSSGAKSGYYLVYYTDGTNVLDGYDELVYAPITGNAVRMEVKDGTFIPQGAKGIAVFESTTRYLDNPPAISTAKAKCAIPASKQLTLSGAELVFGLASDVHMNYEGTGAGAHQKWANALAFYKSQGATHIVVTGDMTGDASDGNDLGEAFTLENQYKKYMELVTAAGFTKDTAIESIGNHSNTTADRGLFTTYTSGSSEVHPYTGSAYFYTIVKGKNGAKDNLFIALQQELDAASGGYKASQSANVDNFSKEQMDWFENLLKQYGNDPNTNVFVLCHSPFRNYGAGEKYNGTYSSVLTFKDEYAQNMRLKHLLEVYKDVTVFSGHTHSSLYDANNYSDMGNTFAHTVHAPSTTAPRAYKNGTNTAWYDTRKATDATYGSETYIVKVYKDYVVYMGYNVSTGKYIPSGCLIVPAKRTATADPDDIFEGSGTASDPYLIQDEGDFLALTNGMNSATSESDKYGDGKYFKQTADIDMRGIESYIGTHANGGVYGTGDARCYFGGNYDGNGYEIKVTIHGPEQRSVFPYCYGIICNVVIRGDIISDYAAQPIRTNRGSIVNCIFDCYLDAYMTSGVVYSNYTYLYNVYTSGMMKGTSLNPVAAGNDGSAYVGKVFHHYIKTDGATVPAGSVGNYTEDLGYVVSMMNSRSDIDYTSAASLISPSLMSKSGIILGRLELGHDGELPAPKNIPTSGNIAGYGIYTVSQLYRQGGQEVDWGWDLTAPITYPDETGSSLNDGILSSAAEYSDPAWIGFHAKAPQYKTNGYHSIVFEYADDVSIDTINVFVGTSELQQGIKVPDSIELLCDGVSVTTVTPTDVTTESGIATEKVVIDVQQTGKKFELRFTNAAWVFVSEVQLMAYQPQAHVCSPDGSGWHSDKNSHWNVCSCKEKLNSDSHDSGKWVTVKEADVHVEGKKELRCTVCQYVIKTETIPEKHDYSKTWSSDKTNHWHKCSCGDKIEVTSHDNGKWIVTKNAEIGVEGTKELRCTVCDYLLKTEKIPALTEEHVCGSVTDWYNDDNNHWKLCSCGKIVDSDAHTQGQWQTVTKADVDKEGLKELRCSVCDYLIDSETISAIHAAETDKWFNDSANHWQECGCGEKLNAASHDDGQWIVTKKAEIGVEGSKELRCSVCDYVIKTETIPALKEDHKHSADKSYSYDKDSHWNYCSCGEVMNTAKHVEGQWVIVKEAQIGVDGEKAVYCEVCGYKINSEIIPALKEEQPPVDESFVLGDINANEKIDMTDYILLKRAYFGTYTFTETQNKVGDINKNNKIDMTDYILLKRMYFGTYTIK